MRFHPDVAIREEPFGALAYHYGNRKLLFLRDEQLLATLRSIDNGMEVELALTTHAGTRAASVRAAIDQLVRSEVLIDDTTE